MSIETKIEKLIEAVEKNTDAILKLAEITAKAENKGPDPFIIPVEALKNGAVPAPVVTVGGEETTPAPSDVDVKEADKEVTKEDLRAIAGDLIKQLSREEASLFIKNLGYNNMREIPEASYNDVYFAIKAKLEEGV